MVVLRGDGGPGKPCGEVTGQLLPTAPPRLICDADLVGNLSAQTLPGQLERLAPVEGLVLHSRDTLALEHA